MDEEYWCIHWSGEVLPEPAMIPDVSVFLRTSSVSAQALTIESRSRQLSFYAVREVIFKERQKQGPALLKLPFVLSPSVEKQKVFVVEQPDFLKALRSGGKGV